MRDKVYYKYMKKDKKTIENFNVIAIASHQLRTPLSIMKGYLSMALQGDFGKIQEKKLQKVLETLYQNNENLIYLIENLLTKTRLETNSLQLNVEKINLNNLVKNIISDLKPKAKTKKISLQFIKSKNIPYVMVDSILIRQAIINVIDNAISYTKKGKVIVEISVVKKKVIIIVSDTGPGLSSEKIKILFKLVKPWQLGKSSSDSFGLGLYISQLLIKAHKGKISARSLGRKGLEVQCMIPLAVVS